MIFPNFFENISGDRLLRPPEPPSGDRLSRPPWVNPVPPKNFLRAPMLVFIIEQGNAWFIVEREHVCYRFSSAKWTANMNSKAIKFLVFDVLNENFIPSERIILLLYGLAAAFAVGKYSQRFRQHHDPRAPFGRRFQSVDQHHTIKAQPANPTLLTSY